MKKLIIIVPLILSLFSPLAYCGDDYIKGEIAVIFKADVKEEDARNFIKRFNLEILKENGFEPHSLHLNIENNVDAFIKEIQKEALVDSAVKGGELELNGRKGRVVRVRFKNGTSQDKIEDISFKYKNRKEVIGWRYYRSDSPSMVIKVPGGKERDWLKILNGADYKNIVDSAMLVGLGI